MHNTSPFQTLLRSLRVDSGLTQIQLEDIVVKNLKLKGLLPHPNAKPVSLWETGKRKKIQAKSYPLVEEIDTVLKANGVLLTTYKSGKLKGKSKGVDCDQEVNKEIVPIIQCEPKLMVLISRFLDESLDPAIIIQVINGISGYFEKSKLDPKPELIEQLVKISLGTSKNNEP